MEKRKIKIQANAYNKRLIKLTLRLSGVFIQYSSLRRITHVL